MGKKARTPPAPDPAELSRQQAIENRRTQRDYLDATRTSTVNPFGRTSWNNNRTLDQAGFDAATAAQEKLSSTLGGALLPKSGPNREEFMRDNWTNTQTLSPESQGIYDTATSKLQTATEGISTDPLRYNQDLADAIQRRMSRYTDPAMAQARSSMQSNLADRGFQVGNEGYNTEMTRLDDSQNQSRADIADRAQITGSQQGLQELSMQQQIARTLSDLRNQQVMGVAGMPTTTAAQQMQPFDISGAMMDQWSDRVDAANSQGSLFGSLLPAAGAVVGGMYGGAPGAAVGAQVGGAAAGGGRGSGSSRQRNSFY